VVAPRAQRDEPGVGRKRFEYPHGALPTEDAHLRGGEAGVSLLAETQAIPASYGLKLNCGGELTAGSPCGAGSRGRQCPGYCSSGGPPSASRLAPLSASRPPRSRSGVRRTCESPDSPPELADSVGSLEVGEHQDMEQFGAGSGTEGVEALL
jgi:hypothetical protein